MARPPEIVSKRTKTYIEEAWKKIEKQPGIKEIMVLNSLGNPVRSTIADEQLGLQYAGLYGELLEKSKFILKAVNPNDSEIQNLRVRTKYDETILSPDGKITFLIIQSAEDRNKL